MPHPSESAPGPAFRVEIDQNPHLPLGAREVHAVVGVTSETPVAAGDAVRANQVVVVDTSGSMYGQKINAAKRAARAAVETLRDGVRFAVVAGHREAQMIYPSRPALVEVDDRTRAEAYEAIGRLRADGGTRMGAWLKRAASLFEGADGPRHTILLTDGQNNESRAEFTETLESLAGTFVCDCRGVGTDWRVEDLRLIDEALLGGGPGLIADPDDLVEDFRAMARTSMGKSVADVALRLWTPQNAVVRYVKQVAPTVQELTARAVERVPQAGDYPTGSWGAESRDYHVCVEVPPGDPGRQMRAGWVRVVLPGGDGAEDRVLASGNILAEWTADEERSTGIDPRVAHYTGQAELAEAIQEGLAARRDGDEDTATTRLGRAVALAHESGDEETTRLLSRVVDVVDAGTGTVRLRSQVDKVDEMTLDTNSTRTVRTRARREPPGPDGTP
ncbi:VWA domain-containing protein [Nocardiopsis sp. HNM0947]|uniref:VWA domain-containing protein n=1 Tax=Nocardiopsis coralli TaxID=2772213 RepID=A0ABR9P2F0_9ACTN|nr:VWA domain-containing protein [Nocardiopsis coralli]MBE2998004.1 VWA domain-containing protein [Nocardiopsis coralli]